MKRAFVLSLLTTAPLLSFCTSSTSPPLAESPSARATDLIHAFTSAWNVHDAQALGQTFTTDADFTNVYGVHAHGRDGITSFHARAFKTVFAASTLTADTTDLLTVTAASAAVDVHWSMTGATIRGWPPTQHGIISWTLAAQADGTWLIAVMTNRLV